MNWYCIRTKPKKEGTIADYCRTVLGLQTYYPRLRQQKTIRRVRKQVVSPLFPRYFFCRFDAATCYRAVRYAPEVIEIVHAGNQPAIVQPGMIDELQQWAGEILDRVFLRPPFRPGDKVEITDGPLRGIPAVILNTSDADDRVAVLLSILQCGAQMKVNCADLKLAS